MDKIFNRLKKAEIPYTVERFGCSYFDGFGVPSIGFDVAGLVLDYDTTNADDFRKIANYCRKYGYVVMQWGGYPGYSILKICRADDLDRLRIYQRFADASAAACNAKIHIRYTAGTDETDADFNARLHGIMQFYADEYSAAISAECGSVA